VYSGSKIELDLERRFPRSRDPKTIIDFVDEENRKVLGLANAVEKSINALNKSSDRLKTKENLHEELRLLGEWESLYSHGSKLFDMSISQLGAPVAFGTANESYRNILRELSEAGDKYDSELKKIRARSEEVIALLRKFE